MTGCSTTWKGNMKKCESYVNLRTSSSKSSGYIIPHLPSYDGFGSDEYINQEIEMDKIFAKYCLCDRRKIKNATSSLTSYALLWWKNLCYYDENPQTQKDMKQTMRGQFVSDSHSIKLICEFEISRTTQ